MMMQYKTDLSGGEITGNLRVEKQSEDVVDGRAECMVNFMEILRGDTQKSLHVSTALQSSFHINGPFRSFSLFKGNSC